MTDARFEDGEERPLRLIARDHHDLAAVSALVQDAIFPGHEVKWLSKRRQFVLLINRFRWEDHARRAERVQSVLSFADVTAVQSSGLVRTPDTVYALLSLKWIAGEDGTGVIELLLAGDGGFRLSVECIEITLRDVTRPYAAPSGQAPRHPQ